MPRDTRHSGLTVGLSLLAMGSWLAAPAAQAQDITCYLPMSFGTIMPCGAAGQVTISPSGTASATGCVSSVGGLQSNGACLISQAGGPTLSPLQISLTAPSIVLNNGAGGTMAVNDFNLETPGGGLVYTTTAFFLDLGIGATLNVGAGQAAGTYTGSFTVNVVLL